MSRTIFCTFLQREAEGQDFQLYPGELGKRIYNEISKEAWAQWQHKQTMLINEIPDILIQVSAINAALNSFNKVLLAEHIRSCVADDIREGKDETIDELVGVLQKLMK